MKLAVTSEEHSIVGGLGSAIAGILADMKSMQNLMDGDNDHDKRID